MSEKKMMIGLPAAILLGGSAIAIGVLPGVRDWIDQTIPWLGINGPKINNVNSLASDETKPSNAEPFPGTHSEMGTPVSMTQTDPLRVESSQVPQAMPQRHAVEFAGGPVYPAAQNVNFPAPQNTIQLPAPNNDVRLAQARALETVPLTGQYVPSRDSSALVVEQAQVKFFEESKVAAQAEGIITKLSVDEGSMIEAGAEMIEIDTRLVEKEIRVSERELHAAKLKAKDDSNVKFSRAAKKVAQQDVEISNDLASRGAENFMEGVKKRLELEKAGFQVSVSEIEKERDAADVEVKEAKHEAAKVQLELRRILAQRTGIVTNVEKRQYDWVRAGEVIFTLTSMKKLRVQGTAKVIDSPHLLLNAPARVTIFYAEGKSETLDGVVNFVSPRAEIRNQYKLHVDLDNRLTSDGQYLFRDGMVATIEITPRSR